MSNDLVVQLGARLDQFAADMNQAGDMADSAVSRIESSFANLNPGLGGFAGFGAIVTGAVGSVTALLAVLQHVNSELADIAKNAEFVGVSVERFQQLQFAATQGGISSEQATTDLRNVARLLADAKENENSLTKLLDTNNVKYTDRNGDVVKLNQLLTIAGDLINRFHSMPEKVEAAKALGLSESWVQALKNGSKAFDDVAASADAAGAVIDRSTIAKAEAFDIAWKKSSALLSSQFKAVTADIAGWLDGLIDKASDFITALAKSNGATAGSGQDKFNAIADALDVARKDAQGLDQDFEQVNRVLERYKGLASADPGVIAGLEEVRAKAKAIADEAERAARAFSAGNFPSGVPTPASRPSSADDTADNDAKLASRKNQTQTRDQFQIAVDDITKRTATIKADTAALFENNTVQAQLRAEFRELTAIMRDHGEVTQEQIDKYEKLRTTMSAQQALTAAGITLTKEHAEAFISSSESIKTATAAYDKARDALNRINSASAQIGSALSTAFSDAIVEGKHLNEVFNSLLKTLEKAAINSLFTSLFNPGVGGGLSPAASVLKGIIPGFADGTDSAPGGPAWVGEHGPELVNLPRGAQVIPNAVASRQGGGGSTIQNTFMVAGEVSPGTIERLMAAVVAAHRKIDSQAKVISSTQRLQLTGVG